MTARKKAQPVKRAASKRPPAQRVRPTSAPAASPTQPELGVVRDAGGASVRCPAGRPIWNQTAGLCRRCVLDGVPSCPAAS